MNVVNDDNEKETLSLKGKLQKTKERKAKNIMNYNVK